MKNDFDVVIIGAGVIGLAIGRELAQKKLRVLLLEKNKSFGEETSSRNSEVIHAGIYYPYNSLKRKHCIEGRELLYQYCKENNIPHKKIGKLIVANGLDQEANLHQIYKQGIENGVKDLKIIDEKSAKSLEPNVHCTLAIHSPSSGIIDSHSFMLSLLGKIESNYGDVCFNAPVTGIEKISSGFNINVGGLHSTTISSRNLINCAGLAATEISQMIEVLKDSSTYKPKFCKGNYFSYTGKAPFSMLIYPIPDQDGLGIHSTSDLAGAIKFGPDTEWVDKIDYKVEEELRSKFYNSIKKYYPAIEKHNLNPSYSGIRPKIFNRDGIKKDYVIQQQDEHNVEGYIALYGIESPGLTASLSIAKHVSKLVFYD